LATEHPKVTAYIPQPILNALDSWKSQNDIESRSAAIVAILADYLAVAYPVGQTSTAPTALGNLPGTVLAELAKIEKRVTTLEQQILSSSAVSVALPSTLLTQDTESTNTADLESTGPVDEALSTVPNTVPLEFTRPVDEALSTVPNTVPLESTRTIDEALSTVLNTVPMAPLSQAALAKRLGCSDKAIEKHRKQDSKESFADWSCERDPDNIAWTWFGGGGRGQPLRFVPHSQTKNT
jgi:hypothetical protein